ncbi:unnamed protein product [Tuber aestivum]|uniref:Clr5 domain-containing protein n=1 Tax=Tuber aestivum TaxID=59557 RepID=A0A292PQ46_9PEZI|nr:unnamed protein product [Tuber aestivum]
MTKSWEKHQQLLYELYIEQKHKLRQVMQIMKENHDFVACRRTYMKMFGRWGYQKNRKSQKARRERGVSRELNARLRSAAERPRERLDMASETVIDTCETNGYNPTIKINDPEVAHQTEVVVRGSTPTEATVGSVVSHQSIGGSSSPLDKFRDSDDVLNNPHSPRPIQTDIIADALSGTQSYTNICNQSKDYCSLTKLRRTPGSLGTLTPTSL